MERWWEKLEWWFWRQRMRRRWSANLVIWPEKLFTVLMQERDLEYVDALGEALYGKS